MTLTTQTPAYSSQLAATLATAPAVDATDPSAVAITAWLSRLMQLQGVPFQYLVPDPLMLPAESIGFFIVDPNWITCLVDGAYSIGQGMVGLSPAAQATQAASLTSQAQPAGQQAMSGFVLRSAVITDFPGLQVKGYLDSQQQSPATLLRYELVAPGIALALFAGALETVIFSEPTETLHFGFQPPVTNGAPYTKPLRYADAIGANAAGQPILTAPNGGTAEPLTVDVPFRGSSTTVVDLAALATTIQAALVANDAIASSASYSAAQFGMELTEGAEEVQFTLSAPTALATTGVSP